VAGEQSSKVRFTEHATEFQLLKQSGFMVVEKQVLECEIVRAI
jgi:hypothetical protein